MQANNGTTASKVIADLCGDQKIAEEVSERLKAEKVRDRIEYIYAISHGKAQEVREGKEVDIFDVLTRIEFYAREALDEPLRNCDVGTAEEQQRRFVDFCERHSVIICGIHRCDQCPLYFDNKGCGLTWAQMPYEESEVNYGSK